MIIDKSLQVSALQALSGTSGIPSSHFIDLGEARRLIGPGDPLWWVIAARVGLAGTSPTLKIEVETDDSDDFGSAVALISKSLAAADFPTGARIVIPMPHTNKRYLRLLYTPGGTNPTATVDAFLTNQEPMSWLAYPGAPNAGTTTTTTSTSTSSTSEE
jgi:hypothetical protein